MATHSVAGAFIQHNLRIISMPITELKRLAVWRGAICGLLVLVGSSATAQNMAQGAYTCFRVDTSTARHDAVGLYVEVVLEDILDQFEFETTDEAEVCFASQSDFGDVETPYPVLVCLEVDVTNPDPINGIRFEAQTLASELNGIAYEASRFCIAAEAQAEPRRQ
ncbi:MAG: hypothetical protein AAF311_16145 [Pseudomonadota bacterium]